MEPNWLKWAKQLAALAQNGLMFSQNDYDIERYEHIRDLAAEMMAKGFDWEKKGVVDLLVREEGYATPKVDVRGAAFRNGKILLVKEALDGGWTLPGGWADPYESPTESIVREIYEESGFETRAIKLAAVYDRSKHPHLPLIPFHVYKLFFLCDITGGQATESHETTAVAFFAEDNIPQLSVSRVLPFQITHMFEHYRDRALPTDFD